MSLWSWFKSGCPVRGVVTFVGPSARDFVVDFESVVGASVASPKQQAGLRTSSLGGVGECVGRCD